MLKLTLVTLLSWYYLYVVQGQQSCKTPSGATGSCIFLDECSPLMPFVSEPNKSPQDVNTLQHSQCGFEGQTPKVCCPQAEPPPSDVCFTPDAKEGKCINVYSCQHIADMLKPPVANNAVVFVKNSRCLGPDQYSVCCGPPSDKNPPKVGSPIKGCSLTAAPPDPRTRCCGDQLEIGGLPMTSTYLDEYPWTTLIEYTKNNKTKLLCGGSLISGNYVLTAGHCVTGPILAVGTPRNIRLGEYDTSNDVGAKDCMEMPGGGEDCTPGVTVIPIEKTIPHPDFNAMDPLKRNDIALIRLRQIAPYTDFIRPICLPQIDVTVSQPDLTLNVAGWGTVNETHSGSKIKLHGYMPYVPTEKCQPDYNVPPRNISLWSGQLCAGGSYAANESCKGDSGGSLVYENEGIFKVVGVFSFGPTPCGIENIPAVYTKVYEYNTWIRSQIKP